MTTDQAIKILVSSETLPPQIDYISPSDKAKVKEAQKFIDNLPENEKWDAENKIGNTIDSYYCSYDGQPSVAELDALF